MPFKFMPLEEKKIAKELTPRQRAVLEGLAGSETIKGLALKLGVSNKTIEYHKARLMDSLGIFDIAGLTRFAIRAGVIAP